MSPRRKSGLSPEDLQALKHLPAVIRALENLQEQHAKVRALMGSKTPPDSLLASVNRVQRSLDALPELPTDPAGRLLQVQQWVAEGRISWQVARRLLDFDPSDPNDSRGFAEAIKSTPPPPSPILDTPERREYEAAKKAGKQVPPDLVNISDAQRERMAEQKALVQQMRQAKGLPVRTMLDGVGPIKSREDLAAAIPEIAGEVVRTEELPMSESGSVGGEEDPEVH